MQSALEMLAHNVYYLLTIRKNRVAGFTSSKN
jgi:hypothetical protein